MSMFSNVLDRPNTLASVYSKVNTFFLSDNAGHELTSCELAERTESLSVGLVKG